MGERSHQPFRLPQHFSLTPVTYSMRGIHIGVEVGRLSGQQDARGLSVCRDNVQTLGTDSASFRNLLGKVRSASDSLLRYRSEIIS